MKGTTHLSQRRATHIHRRYCGQGKAEEANRDARAALVEQYAAAVAKGEKIEYLKREVDLS